MAAGTGPPGLVYEDLDGSGPDTAVSVILKLRGEPCDIACLYCYENCLYCYEKRKEAPGGARITADEVRRLTRRRRPGPAAG